MTKMTITQALAAIKLTPRKIDAKMDTIKRLEILPADKRDPNEKVVGGSAAVIASEKQAIRDLADYQMRLRLAVQEANLKNTIEVLGETRSVAYWIA